MWSLLLGLRLDGSSLNDCAVRRGVLLVETVALLDATLDGVIDPQSSRPVDKPSKLRFRNEGVIFSFKTRPVGDEFCDDSRKMTGVDEPLSRLGVD